MRVMLALVAVALCASAPASATSGFGCYRVNVGPDDPLAVRVEPSASAEVVVRLDWDDQPIIALDGLPRGGEDTQPTLFDVHRAEFANCVPAALPLGARWCPVSLFGAGPADNGWIKRRFVDHNECP